MYLAMWYGGAAVVLALAFVVFNSLGGNGLDVPGGDVETSRRGPPSRTDLRTVPRPRPSGVSIDPNFSPPTFSPPSSVRGVTIDVTRCEVDYDIDFATASVTLSSTYAYDYIGLSGDLVAGNGDVVGQGIGNLVDVQPGRTYRTEVLYSMTGEASFQRTYTCHVRLDTVL